MTTISVLNGTIAGELSSEDIDNPTREGRFADDYDVINLSSGQFVTLNLVSSDFDAYLQLINGDTGEAIAFDDDGGGGTDSQLSFTAANGINYIARVTSFGSGETGNYSLSAVAFDSPPISLPIDLTDSSSFLWDIQTDGSISDGSNDAYDSGLDLSGFPSFNTAQTEENGREIVIGSATIGDVLVTRKIYVPEDQSWARFLEIVTNPGTVAADYTVNIETDIGTLSSVVGTSSGDTTFGTDDVWIVTDDSSDGSGDPTTLHVVAGAGGSVPDTVSQSGDDINYQYNLTLQPGETQIVLHFAAQNEDRATALEKAPQLANLGLGALEGISAEEAAQVVNFGIEGFLINDVTVLEGDSGITNAIFTVTLLGSNTDAVTVDYATADGTATAGEDYTATSGTLTFNPGETTQTVTVEVIGETNGELDENFFLNLSNASNGEIVDNQGIGTIDTDDLVSVDLELSLLVDISGSVDSNEYQLQLEGYAVSFENPDLFNNLISQGLAGQVAVNLILWSSSDEQQESVGWTLIDSVETSQAFAQEIRETSRAFSGGTDPGSAIDFAVPLFFSNDFDGRLLAIDVSGNEAQNEGISTSTARDNALAAGIDVINGIVIGGDSGVLSFYENSLIGGANADGDPAFALTANTFEEFAQILNNKLTQELTPPPQISIVDLSQEEGDSGVTELVFTVNVSRINDQPITVAYATEAGTAIADLDYTPTSGTLTFNAGETSQTITVEVIGDNRVEIDETFSVNLSNATNADIADNQAIGTIENEDEIQLSNSRIDENSVNGTVIGTFTATDPEDTESFTFSLGDDAGGRFTIVGNELQVAGLLNFETNNSHNITVRATDGDGNEFDRTFTISLNDVNETPTAIQLNNATIDENSPNGTVVGLLTRLDPDVGDTLVLTLLDDAGGRFAIVGNELQVGDGTLLDFEANSSHDITVQVTDNGGLSFETVITITVNDIEEGPQPDLVVSNISVPQSAFSGEQVEVIWTVTNQGGTNASGTWTDRVLLSDDTQVGGDQVLGTFEFTGTIAAGESIERRQIVTLAVDLSGERYFIVQTDANNAVVEGLDNNNTAVDEQAICGNRSGGRGTKVPRPQIAITRSPFPNLQVTEITPPPTAFSEQSILVEWVVTNTGEGSTTTPFWSDQVFLSLDQTLDANDVNLGTAINPSFLAGGDSYRNSLEVTLPQGIQGDYFFLVETDNRNQVDEQSNEGDNLAAGGPTDVELTDPPDLQVTTVSSPAQGFSGQPITLSYTVTNEGEGRTTVESWSDQIFLSTDKVLDENDTFLGSNRHTGVLNSGESYSETQTVNLPIGVSGNFFFIVSTDVSNEVFEFVFEDNNTGSDGTLVNLTPPPDLEVELVQVPETARAGESLTISYRLANNGSTVTPNSFWNEQFYLSVDNRLDTNTDLFLGSRTHNGALEAGESVDKSATFALGNELTGNFFAFVVTDSGDAVFELDNENNTSVDGTGVTIVSQPADLRLKEVSLLGKADTGQGILVTYNVLNEGIGDTIVNSWTDQVFASPESGEDILLASFTRNGLLGVGEDYSRSEIVEIPFTLEGNYNLFVVTDVNNDVFEAEGEDNNQSEVVSITVTRELADLQVTGVGVTVETIRVGESLTITWTVENFGEGETNSNFWYDSVYLSLDNSLGDGNDIFLGRVRRANSLSSGGEYEATGTFTVPFNAEGEFFVIVRSDSSDLVLEETQNNGVSLGTITIQTNPEPLPNVDVTPAIDPTPILEQDPVDLPPEFFPDLVVINVEAEEAGISGQLLQVTWVVRNNGLSTGNRSWFDTVYLSRDQIFDRTTDISLGSRLHVGLEGEESYTQTDFFPIPRGLSGPFYVFVATDSSDRLNEPDGELNNSNYDTTPVQVSLPNSPDLIDLVVGTITVPANGVPGSEATITYNVENQGTEAVGGS